MSPFRLYVTSVLGREELYNTYPTRKRARDKGFALKKETPVIKFRVEQTKKKG